MKTVHTRKINSRAVAAELIGDWLETGAFADHLVETVEDNRSFIMEVVYGVARWKQMLEWVARRCARRSPGKEVLPFLFTGLYQVMLMDKVEEYAAVNETVEAVKSRGLSHAVAFTNAVLRKAIRERDSIRQELDKQRPAIRLSHPGTLVDRWKKQFGEQEMIRLLDWNNSRPEVVVRPNRTRTTFQDYGKLLGDEGIEAVPHVFAPGECFSIARGVKVTELPGYDQGLFTVQDPSTLVSVGLLDPRPGEFVLDACAAPGGKTSVIAEHMGGKGRVVAMDIGAERLEALRENLARLGIKSVTVLLGDASSQQDMEKACDGKLFDRILLDVPCTNTGVLRRRPDAKWRFSMKVLNKLVDTQKKILANAVVYLKPGGVLVYSTCSLEREENDAVIDGWLSSSTGFEKIESRQLFPPDSRTDGAYACAIRNRGG
jgi:16S rRNA (cytosine967-C5)-methyltransferase